MHNWVYSLGLIYPVILLRNISEINIVVEKLKYDKNILLVLDASLINEAQQLSHFCQYIKKVIVVGKAYTPRQQIQFIFDGACGYSEK